MTITVAPAAALRERLTGLVSEILGWSPSRHLRHDLPLRDLGMNSIKIVNLMLSVEAAFDLTIPEAELTPENFVSIESVEALVERLMGSAPV